MVNVLNAPGWLTLKWLIVFYVNVTSVKKTMEGRKEEREGGKWGEGGRVGGREGGIYWLT